MVSRFGGMRQKAEWEADMKLLVISMMLLLTSLYTPTLLAGSMECGGRIFEDGQEVGPYKGEILKACGPPSEQNGGQWIYVRQGASNKILRFDDSGQLESIFDQSGDQ